MNSGEPVIDPSCDRACLLESLKSFMAALEAGARIVIEAKESVSYDLGKTLEEAHTAAE